MATLSSCATNVTNMIRRSDLVAEAKTEIGNAIRHYSRRATWVNERRGGTITTVASQTWYTTIDNTAGAGIESSPSGTTPTATDSLTDLIRITYAKLEQGTVDWPLDVVDYRYFETLTEGSSTESTPRFITHYVGQIGLWPTPGAAYTVYLSGFYKPTVPSADSNESVWLTQYQELIESSAARRLAMKWLQDAEMAQMHSMVEQEQERLLIAEGAARRTTGTLRAEFL